MKRIFVQFIIGTFICTLIKPAFALNVEVTFENKAVQELTELSVMQLDIGRAALILAKEVYPDLDVELYSKEIDRMVDNVRRITKGSKDPEYRIRALNTYLYQMEKIQYDLSDPQAHKLDNMYLNGLLRSKKGSCITMPLLYLAIAQRLEYPIFPVAAPWHLFLRYVTPGFKKNNIEATGGGGYSSDEEYIQVLQVSPKALKSGAYMRTMDYREFLGDLLTQNGFYWARNDNLAKSLDYFIMGVKLNPKSADNLKALGIIHMMFGKRTSGNISASHFKYGNEFLGKADDMGVTKLSNSGYISEQKKAQEEYRKKLSSKGGQ